MSEVEKIGFVGAGLMGQGMASNLLKAGHPVMLYVHRNRSGIDRLVGMGASETSSLAELAAKNEVIVLCVSNADTVRSVIGEMLPQLCAGQWIIDATTSDPGVTKEIAAALRAKGVSYADTPVTGGPPESEAGRLGSLVGCADADFETVKRLVSCYSRVVHRVGGVGCGHQAKLLNNFVTQGTSALLAEAYCRARENGVDWRALYSVMETGAARSGTLEKMVRPALDGNYDGSRFSLRNALKDLNYFCGQAADSERGPSRLAESIREVFKEAVDAGQGDRYVSALLDPGIRKRE